MGGDVAASIWHGVDIRLQAVEPGDWEWFHAWNLGDEETRALDRVPFPQLREAGKRWAEAESTRGPEGVAFRFVIEDREGAVVGSIATHSCDRRAGAFGYGVSVAAPFRRRDPAAEAIFLELRCFFTELGYQTAHVHVHAFNVASAALHGRLGFRLEGRLHRMVLGHWRHHDVLA